jgi:hypothetical protein
MVTNGFIPPCIPTRALKPPAGPDWVHEIKHDGYRLQVRRECGTVRLFTRNGYDWSARYPAIAVTATRLRARSFTLDGEAVVCGPDGVAIFDALHRHGTVSDAMLYAFDLLELDGEDLRRFHGDRECLDRAGYQDQAPELVCCHGKSTRRFPPRWRAEPIPGGYVVRDATGQALSALHEQPAPLIAAPFPRHDGRPQEARNCRGELDDSNCRNRSRSIGTAVWDLVAVVAASKVAGGAART